MSKRKKREEQPPEMPVPARRRTDASAHSFLPLAIGITGGVALASVAFWFFKEQAERVVEGSAERLDTAFMDMVHSAESPAVSRILHAATLLGTHPGVGTVAGLSAITMLRKHRRHDAWTVIMSTGGAMALNTILKHIFQRQRPQELARRIKLPSSHSFPSGHSLLSAATFPIVMHHMVQRKAPAVQIAGHGSAMLLISAVGYSRIYFGVHFPSDVLAGFAAGFGWLGLTSLTHTLAEMDRRKRDRARLVQ